MSDPKATWMAGLGVTSLSGGDGGEGDTTTAPPPAPGDGGDGGTSTGTASPPPTGSSSAGGDGSTSTTPPGDGGDGSTSTAPPPSGDGGDGRSGTPPSGDGGDGSTVSTTPPSASDLDQQFNAAVQAGDWRTAAETLNAFDADDIKSELAALSAETIAKIHQGALDNPRVGPQSQVALMTGGASPPSGDGGDGASTTPASGDGGDGSASPPADPNSLTKQQVLSIMAKSKNLDDLALNLGLGPVTHQALADFLKSKGIDLSQQQAPADDQPEYDGPSIGPAPEEQEKPEGFDEEADYGEERARYTELKMKVARLRRLRTLGLSNPEAELTEEEREEYENLFAKFGPNDSDPEALPPPPEMEEEEEAE